MSQQSNAQRMNFLMTLYPNGKPIQEIIRLTQEKFHMEQEDAAQNVSQYITQEKQGGILKVVNIEVNNQVAQYVQLTENGEKLILSAVEQLYLENPNDALQKLNVWWKVKHGQKAKEIFLRKIQHEIDPFFPLFLSFLKPMQKQEAVSFQLMATIDVADLEHYEEEQQQQMFRKISNVVNSKINRWIRIGVLQGITQPVPNAPSENAGQQAAEQPQQNVTLFVHTEFGKRVIHFLSNLKQNKSNTSSQSKISVVSKDVVSKPAVLLINMVVLGIFGTIAGVIVNSIDPVISLAIYLMVFLLTIGVTIIDYFILRTSIPDHVTQWLNQKKT